MIRMMINAAQNVIQKCGGHNIVASWAGVHVCNVYRWTYPKEKGGMGGVIPAQKQQKILKNAQKHGVRLRPEDFFCLPIEQITGGKVKA